jgi:hypothetical protein
MQSNQKIWAFTRKDKETGEGGDHDGPPERETTPNSVAIIETGAAGQGFLSVIATHRQHPTIP